jgi:hypothetical protein
MKLVLNVLAGMLLLLFAGVWIVMAVKLLQYDATPAKPKVDYTDALVTVAGFMSSAVAAGTASVLGIEIQKVNGGETQSLASTVNTAARSSSFLVAGILLYALVGAFVLVVWLFKSAEAPDLISAFSLGVLGWLAGAFAAVFRKS